MDFDESARVTELRTTMWDFVRECVWPAEARYWSEFSAATIPQPATSAATAEEPLPTNGSQTVIPGAALPASMRENSSTGFCVG